MTFYIKRVLVKKSLLFIQKNRNLHGTVFEKFHKKNKVCLTNKNIYLYPTKLLLKK